MNLITLSTFVDMSLKCYLQIWVDVVSNSTAYLNTLFNFPEKTSDVIGDYYQTCFVLYAALLFQLAIPCIED